MPRNLDHRVEATAEVTDPSKQARLDQVLEVNLADDVLAWSLSADGWTKVPTVEGIDTHVRLQQVALQRTKEPRVRKPRLVRDGTAKTRAGSPNGARAGTRAAPRASARGAARSSRKAR
jgi:hypothetical protein